MTQFAGKGIEVGASAIFPYASNTPLPGLRSSVTGFGGGTSDTGNDALVANGYFTYQFTPKPLARDVAEFTLRAFGKFS